FCPCAGFVPPLKQNRDVCCERNPLMAVSEPLPSGVSSRLKTPRLKSPVLPATLKTNSAPTGGLKDEVSPVEPVWGSEGLHNIIDVGKHWLLVAFAIAVALAAWEPAPTAARNVGTIFDMPPTVTSVVTLIYLASLSEVVAASGSSEL